MILILCQANAVCQWIFCTQHVLVMNNTQLQFPDSISVPKPKSLPLPVVPNQCSPHLLLYIFVGTFSPLLRSWQNIDITLTSARTHTHTHTHTPSQMSAHHRTGTLGDILLQFEGGCVIGQLLQIITSTEIPSWRRPQNYKVWQLESQRGRENDEDEKNNKLSWSPRAAIWIAACFGLAGTQMLLFPKEPKSNT